MVACWRGTEESHCLKEEAALYSGGAAVKQSLLFFFLSRETHLYSLQNTLWGLTALLGMVWYDQ